MDNHNKHKHKIYSCVWCGCQFFSWELL